MEIFLVRHGEAKHDHEDPRRSLTDGGRAAVATVARAAAAKKVRIEKILHSEKLRAKETAEILAGALSPARGIREISGLAPEDDPLIAKIEIEASSEPLMLVGHLPHIDRLAALLLTGDSESAAVDFTPATMACLSRAGGAWSLIWILRPESVRRS